MSKQTLYILGILGTMLLGAFFYPKICCTECCEKNSKKTQPAIINAKEMGSLFKIDGNNFTYSCTDNFKFSTDGFNNLPPIKDSITLGISNLKTHFDRNKNQKLLITGYALNSEKNTSAFPNLAIARANDIKNYFVSKGFDASRFEIKGELLNILSVSNDTVYNAANYAIVTDDNKKVVATEDWSKLKEKINANPLVLYFNTNQTEINLTVEERQKIADLSNFLDHVPDAKISCIGHTDGIGKRETNIVLGQNRADFAKKYLAKNGISSDKIESSSKGPDEPIADNKTAEGKSKNRRTVVNLK